MYYLVLCWHGMMFQEYEDAESAFDHAKMLIDSGIDIEAIEIAYLWRDQGDVFTVEEFKKRWKFK